MRGITNADSRLGDERSHVRLLGRHRTVALGSGLRESASAKPEPKLRADLQDSWSCFARATRAPVQVQRSVQHACELASFQLESGRAETFKDGRRELRGERLSDPEARK